MPKKQHPIRSMHPVHYIVVPGLLDSLATWKRDFDFEPSAGHLLKCLAGLNKSRTAQQNELALIHQLLQKNTQSPQKLSHALACYRKDFGQDPESEVLCAHPIELEVGMSDISVSHQLVDDSDEIQKQQLMDELNRHFSQDDWQFVVSTVGNWYLLLPKNQRPSKLLPVHQALGKSLRGLTDNEDKKEAFWNRQLTELQMLLYSSRTNQMRESQKQRLISSFWLWDINETALNKKESMGLSAEFIAGGGYDGQAIAAYYGLDWMALDQLSHEAMKRSGIVYYDAFSEATRLNDPGLWQRELTQFESFIEHQLDKQQQYTLINSCFGYTWKSGKRKIFDLFSRKPKSLLDYT